MDWDERAELAHGEICNEWGRKFQAYQGQSVASWVSSFRNGQPSDLVDDHFGSFNWGCRVRFHDGVEWLVRFAVPGRVMDGDEKVRREVATMSLIKRKTTIPVPNVHAWGLSRDNPLGLGPFIIMDFVKGEALGSIWQQTPAPEDGKILSSDISESDMRHIYRQIGGFLLQLSKLEFPQVSSLRLGCDGSISSDLSPLTLKMQEIEAHGGVKVGGQREQTFSSTTEYFKYVAQQDMEQLHEQPNSIDDAADARSKYVFRHQFNTLIPRFVDKKYDRAPFRLVCDDFRYGNMIVNNATDLEIIAVIDWEWAYAAPYQMFYSPPRWLLIKKPIYWKNRDALELERYQACLEIFLDELSKEEEGQNRSGSDVVTERLSDLMRRSMADGKFWFHELLYACYTGVDNPAWNALRSVCPEVDNSAAVSAEELEKFVEKKLNQLQAYSKEWDALRPRSEETQDDESTILEPADKAANGITESSDSP